MLLKIQTAEKAVLEVQGKINNTVRKSELEIFQLAFFRRQKTATMFGVKGLWRSFAHFCMCIQKVYLRN